MKGVIKTVKRALGVMLATALTAGALVGCQYESFDDYLKALGIKDPTVYNDDIFESTSADDVYVTSQDVPADKGQDSAASYTDAGAETPGIGKATDGTTPDVAGGESGADITTPKGTGAATPSSEDAATTSLAPGHEGKEQATNEAPADATIAPGYKKANETDLDDKMKAARVAIGLTDEGIANLKNKQKGLYAYDRLTDSGQTLYVEILTILNTLSKDIIVSTTSDEAIELVFDYVMADHPEIFYVDGYQYTNYSVGDTITKISFTGNYLYDANEVARRQTQINDGVARCLAGAPSSEDDYYVIKYIYEYLIANIEYDVNAPDNQNICSVFINGRSVCNGYAKAAQLLLNKLGIPSTLVTGTVDTKNAKGVRHAWNLVLCNNTYYYLDVTWGDASYQTVSGESADASKLPDVNYDYLNVSTQEISRNHSISDIIRMPACNSMNDNYYVREDEYFNMAELALVAELFDRRYKDGSKNVTIKCATDGVYNELFAQLITDRKVFDYLQGDTSQVSYTTFEDTRTIIFWL